MFLTLVVHRIAPEATLAHIPFLEEELMLPQLLRNEERCAAREFLFCQVNPLEDMLAEKIKHDDFYFDDGPSIPENRSPKRIRAEPVQIPAGSTERFAARPLD